jgi:predicted nucleic acid-binding protein
MLAFVKHLLAAIEPVPITVPVARVHARLSVPGWGPGAHRLWIAATAIAYGWPLATLEYGSSPRRRPRGDQL